MKLVIAYIQPEKLEAVKKSLHEMEIFRISVTSALGCGQQNGCSEGYPGDDCEVNLLKKIRIEIAVNDSFVEATVGAIIKGARTGNIGDGKIFIMPLEECIRIRSGEVGGEAIG